MKAKYQPIAVQRHFPLYLHTYKKIDNAYF